VLKQIIEKNFAVTARVHKNLLRVTNKKAVRKLQEISGIKPFGWETPEVVKRLSPVRRIPYIRGFWDAEGGLPRFPNLCTKAEQRYISFHQKQKEPLHFIRKMLLSLDYIPTKITYCSDAYEFRITRKEYIKRFYKEIGSWHPEKKERLRMLAELLR